MRIIITMACVIICVGAVYFWACFLSRLKKARVEILFQEAFREAFRPAITEDLDPEIMDKMKVVFGTRRIAHVNYRWDETPEKPL